MAIIEGGTDIKVKTSMSIKKCFIRNVLDIILIRYKISITLSLILLLSLFFGYFWFENEKIQNVSYIMIASCFEIVCYFYKKICSTIDSKNIKNMV